MMGKERRGKSIIFLVLLMTLLVIPLAQSADLFSKNQFAVGELIEIDLTGVDSTEIAAEISSQNSLYRYLEITDEPLTFIPGEIGQYTFFVVNTTTESAIFFRNFTVIRTTIQNETTEEETQPIENQSITINQTIVNNETILNQTDTIKLNITNQTTNQTNTTINTTQQNITIANATINVTQETNTTNISLPYFSLPKEVYVVEEKIPITFNKEAPAGFNLLVASEFGLYQLEGATQNTSFTPIFEGEYEFQLTNDSDIIQSEIINVYLPENIPTNDSNISTINDTNITSQPSLRIDKQTYIINENIPIIFENAGNKTFTVHIETGSSTYSLLRIDQTEINFVPQLLGNYSVELVLAGDIVDLAQFTVVEQIVPETTVNESPINETINQTVQNQTTSPVVDKIKEILNETIGAVSVPNIIPDEEIDLPRTLRVRDHSSNNIQYDNIKIFKNQKQLRSLFEKDDYDVEFKPRNKKVKRIVFRKLQLEGQLDLGVDDVSENTIQIGNQDVRSAFAVDPENLAFEEANITVTATGRELWKCAAWDFSGQQCLGTWEKIMNLIPGEEYNITLTPNDPGFAESDSAKRKVAQVFSNPVGTIPQTVDAGATMILDNSSVLDEADYGQSVNTRLDVTNSGLYKISYGCTYLQTGTGNARNTMNTTVRMNGTSDVVPSTQLCYNRRNLFDQNRCHTSAVMLQDLGAGSYLELISTRMAGTQATVSAQDCYLYADQVKNPVSQYYDSVGGQDYDGGPITVNIDAFTHEDPIFETLNNDMINATENGIYKIYYHVCADDTSGQNDRHIARTWLRLNQTRAYSPSFVYSMVRDNNQVAAQWNCNQGFVMAELGAGTTVEIRHDKKSQQNAGSTFTFPNSNWLLLEKMQDEDVLFIYEQLNGQTVADGAQVAIPFDTNVIVGDNYEHAGGSSSITVEEAGLYEVAYNIGVNTTDQGGRHVVCGLLHRNGQKVHPSVACSYGPRDFSNSIHQDSVAANFVTNISAGATLQLMFNASGGDLQIEENATWISIVPLERKVRPNITALNAPLNNSFVNTIHVDFNFTPVDIDSSLFNCTLYTNISGTFEENETIFNPQNNTINNITIFPGDGVFIWNVQCHDTEGGAGWHLHNFTVNADTPPDISGVVTNNGPVDEFESITFTGSCSNPGDQFRLIVCNSTAPTCNSLTDSELIVCNGTNAASTTPTCVLPTGRNDSRTHTGDIATCCDINDNCDPTTVSVNEWSVNGSPVMLNDPSDQGSDVSQPTTAGENVNFSVRAQSPNGDQFFILICETNETNPGQGDCEFTTTTYCSSSSALTDSGGQASCLYTTNPGVDTGNISWHAFVCDDETAPDILCSPANNATGITGSPFYVNNRPQVTTTSSNLSYAKLGDNITISSFGQSDLENDAFQIMCGDSSGNYNLCNSSFVQTQANCSFTSGFNDNIAHTVYCVLNDSHAVSTERTTVVIGDNLRPNLNQTLVNDSDLIVRSDLLLRFNLSANDSGSGIINVTALNESILEMISQETGEYELNTTAAALGCQDDDGQCTIRFRALDNVSLDNITQSITLTIDDRAPNTSNAFINDSDRIVRSTDIFNLNLTVADTNAIVSVLATNASSVRMSQIESTTNYTVNTTASELGCSNNGICNITFVTSDIANNTNDSVVLGILVDDVPPQVIDPELNDSDAIIRSSDWISINVTATDPASGVTNVSVILDGIKNASLLDGNLTGTYSDFGGNHTNITQEDNNSYWYVGNENTGITPYTVDAEMEILYELDEFTSIENLRNFTASVVYCHTGQAATSVRCDGVAPTGTVEADQSVQIFNYTDEAWDTVGNLENDADGTGGELVTNTFDIGGSLDYVNTTSNEVKIRLRAHFTNTLLTQTAFLVVDYVRLDVTGTEAYFSRIEASDKWQLNTTAYDLGCPDPNGLCALNFSAVDLVGNLNESEQLLLTIDDVPPSTVNPVINDSDRIVRSTDIFNLNVSVTDTNGIANVTVENLTNIQMYQIGGTNEWTVNTTASALGCEATNGICNVTFIATDAPGNINASTVLGIVIDNLPPQVTDPEINDSDLTVTTDQSFSLNITVTDANTVANVTVENDTNIQMYQIDATNKWTVNTSALDLSCPNNGICNLTFIATDIAGNINASTVLGIVVDNGPPQVENLLINDSDFIVKSSDVINFSASLIDGSGISSATLNLTSLSELTNNIWQLVRRPEQFGCSEGQCFLLINASDPLGNYNDSEFYNLTIDDTPPQVALNYPPDAQAFAVNSVLFNFTPTDAIDNNLTCNVSIDNIVVNPVELNVTSGQHGEHTESGISEGNHTWNVTCHDDIPHTNASETRAFTIDLSSPVVNISSPVNETEETADPTITFTYNVSDLVTEVASCILILNGEQDGFPDTSIEEDQPQTFVRSLGNDIYVWRVNCTDSVGRVGASPTFNLTVNVQGDSAAPLVTLNEPEDNTHTQDTSVNFTYTPSDSTGILNCTLYVDGEQNATCGLAGEVFDEFSFRRQINITENSAETLTEYQINITLDTHALIGAGSMQSDCRDVVFTNNDTDELPYYLDPVPGCDNESTVFWVRVDTIDASQLETIYMYYGNAEAESRSDKYAVFNYSNPTPTQFIIDPLTATTNTLSVASFVDGNTLQIGATSQVIDEYEQIEYANSVLDYPMSVNSTGPFASSHNFTPTTSMEALAPIAFSGTEFVYRIDRGTNRYYVYAPFADATVEIREGSGFSTSIESTTVTAGTVFESSTDTTDDTTVLVNSTNGVPIMVVHTELTSTDDAFVMYPASKDWWGIGSNQLDIGILHDHTNVTIYMSDGNVNRPDTLNAGDQFRLTNPGDGGDDNGDDAAQHIVSNRSVGVLQVADADGTETTTFLPESELDTEYYIPTNWEYIAVATTQASTDCNVVDATDTIQFSATSDASDQYPFPGRVYFGDDEQTNEGPVKVNCSAPVMVYYEIEDTGSGSNQGDEHNVWNVKQFRQYQYPEPSTSVGAEESLTVPTCRVTNNEVNNFTVHTFDDGTYLWNITCFDNSTDKNAGYSELRNVTIDTIPPSTFTLNSPPNGTISSDVNPELNWTTTSETHFANYTVQVDDSQQFDSINFEFYSLEILDANVSANGLGTDTTWYWRVIGFDIAGNNYTTGNFSYTTDNTDPTVILLSPGDDDWTNNTLTTYYYQPSDTHLKNCSLYANFTGTFDEIASDNNPSSGAENTFVDVSSPEGVFVWNVQCFDNASNIGWASSNFTQNNDITDPSITLNSPSNLFNTSSSSVTFDWSVTDNLASTLRCNLTIDGVVNETNLAVANNDNRIQGVSGFDEGNYTWNVTCSDQANNSNISSEARLFSVDTSAPIVNLESPANNTEFELAQDVTFEYNVTDTISEILNCSLYINNVYNQTHNDVPKDVTQSFTTRLTSGNYNWSVNCTDSQLLVGESPTYLVIISPPKFILPIEPANATIIDRDEFRDDVVNNVSLIVELSNGAEGETVTFYANLTNPIIEAQTDLLLGTDVSNTTGYARLNFSGRDSVGSKLFAGNYTWWAEATSYLENGTATVLVYGALNISFRFEDELPDPVYGPNQTLRVQEFLKSLGPESDRQVNSSYFAAVNTTFLQSNGTNFTMELIDPDIWPEDENQDDEINVNSLTANNENKNTINDKNKFNENIIQNNENNNNEINNNENNVDGEKWNEKSETVVVKSPTLVVVDEKETEASKIKSEQAFESNKKETIIDENKETSTITTNSIAPVDSNTQTQSESQQSKKLKSKILDSGNKKVESRLTFLDETGNVVEKVVRKKGALGVLDDIGVTASPSLETKEYDVVLEPENSSIEKIKFNDVQYDGTFDVGIDEVPTEKVDLDDKPVFKSYAIDPSEVNFTTARVEVTASGNALYKCVDWNFTTQTCYGDWKKIQKLTPGEKYNVTIDPVDPGFAESNISIINVQSYPTVFNNWTVFFNTTGIADLTISAVKKTTWSNNNDSEDLKFLELRCGDTLVEHQWKNNSVFVPNYYCAETGSETSQVLTKGKHDLKFTFGEDEEYARNFADFFYNLGFEDFEDSFASSSTGACGNDDNCADGFGNFSACNSQGALHHICATTDAALEGSRSGLWDDVDSVGGTANASIWWYSLNTTSACGGLQCDNVIVEYYVAPVSLGANERCWVRAIDSNTEATLSDCEGVSDGTTYGDNGCEAENDPPLAADYDFFSFNLNETPGIDLTEEEINITLGGRVPGGADHCYWDNINLTGFHFNRPPNVTALITPSNNSHQNVTPLDFNFTVTDLEDQQLENCTLWANFSGTWAANYTVAPVDDGVETNITSSPDDGDYIWNIQCIDENEAEDFHDANFTLKVNATPDIEQTVSTPGAVDVGDSLTFSAICNNPGDNVRLLVCNSTATTCDTTTPGNLVICEGSFRPSGNQSCTFTTNATYGGTNTGTTGGCCDDGGLCDPTPVSADDWIVRAPPIVSGGPSDNASDLVSPTAAGAPVNFSVNATDPNLDGTYKMLVCTTDVTPSGPANCDGGASNELCNDFASNEEVASCLYSDTAGLSRNTSWWVFVCDTALCSDAYNGTGVSGSPFYINNNATMLNITANIYNAQLGDSITITSVSANDQEEDLMRLQCGNESTGPFDEVCAGTYGTGERDCTFSYPFDDNLAHTFYCVLNDTHSISATNITIITADNNPPDVVLNEPPNGTYDSDGLVQFNYTPTDATLDDCSLYGSWIAPFGINQTNRTPTSGVLNSFTPVSLDDGTYIWNVFCNDSTNAGNFSVHNFTVFVDTTEPGIELVSPSDGASEELTSSIDFQYEVNDVGANITECALILNGTRNESVVDPEEGNPNNIITSVLPDNVYNWSINCTDFAGNTNQSLSRLLTVAVANFPPTTSLISPEDNGFVNNGDLNLTYTVSDDKGIDNCTLYFDGEENQTHIGAPAGQLNNFTVNNTDSGTHNWSVTCWDNIEQASSAGTFIFTIDTLDPETQLISPPNASSFNDSDRVPFRYNVTDNLAEDMGNCSIFINDILSEPTQANVPINSTQTFLRTLDNQELYWRVECADKAGNRHVSDTWNLTVNSSLKIWNNSEILSDKVEGLYAVNTNGIADFFFPVNLTDTRNMTLDRSPPEINLSSPENNSNTSLQLVDFTFNVSDELTNVSSCELIIDNETVYVNATINQSGPNNFTHNISFGQHTWGINCTDHVGNVGFSGYFNLRVLFRDLAIFAANISLSDVNTFEDNLVEVNATISNLGDEDVEDTFRVNITLIDELGVRSVIDSSLVAGLDAGANTTITTTFNADTGNTTIIVEADTTQIVTEFNESNNNANRSIFVSLYHTFTGNLSGELTLTNLINDSPYIWDPGDTLRANIFAVDGDSSISWTSLQALTRNITTNYTVDDFADLDLALNITNYSVSINRTYLPPNETKNFTVFNVSIPYVPIVNSTNVSAFTTGILWDYSDENTGQYNGSQDVLFVTELNYQQEGKFGVYDYELKVPATLERYLNPNNRNYIAFYTEIR